MIQNDKVNFIRYLLWQLNFFPSKPSENLNPCRIRSIDTYNSLPGIFRERQFVRSERETIDLSYDIYFSVLNLCLKILNHFKEKFNLF